MEAKLDLDRDLFQHQREDLERLLRSKESYCLFSEMGTGKTPIAIGLATKGNYPKTLVICPKTLRLEWARQIQDWTGVSPSVSRRGTSRRLETLFSDFLGKGESNPWFIVNYDTFRSKKHREVLNMYPFDLIVMDEVHRLRNQDTSTTRGVMEFLECQEGARVLAMTGSPIVNRPEDLHTILEIVKPEEYNRYTRREFENAYTQYEYVEMKRCKECGKVTTLIYAHQCTSCGSSWFKRFRSKKLVGVQGLDRLRSRIDKFTIRRTKNEVLKFLPEKYYRRVLLEMSPEQREAYDQMEDELFLMLDDGTPLWAPSMLALLIRLRQLNLEPEIVGVHTPSVKTSFIRDLVEENGKLVIFSTFEKYITYLHLTLDVPHITITGDTPSDDRIPLAMRFNEDPELKLCLATVGPASPGGEGLTLTGASNVVFADRWWTPTTNSQAEDRLHRITQKNAVQVIIPVVEDSIDQILDQKLEQKKQMSDEFLGDTLMMQEVIEDLRKERRRRREENVV